MPEKKKESLDEPRVEQPAEAQPFQVEHDLPTKPVVAPDGHVHLSKEDIANRA